MSYATLGLCTLKVIFEHTNNNTLSPTLLALSLQTKLCPSSENQNPFNIIFWLF